jgi:hypothetical protein
MKEVGLDVRRGDVRRCCAVREGGEKRERGRRDRENDLSPFIGRGKRQEGVLHAHVCGVEPEEDEADARALFLIKKT